MIKVFIQSKPNTEPTVLSDFKSPTLRSLNDFLQRDAVFVLILSGSVLFRSRTDNNDMLQKFKDMLMSREESNDNVTVIRQFLEEYYQTWIPVPVGYIYSLDNFKLLCGMIKEAKIDRLELRELSLDSARRNYLIEAIDNHPHIKIITSISNDSELEEALKSYFPKYVESVIDKSDQNTNYNYIKEIFLSGSVLIIGAGLYCSSIPLCVLGAACFLLSAYQYRSSDLNDDDVDDDTASSATSMALNK